MQTSINHKRKRSSPHYTVACFCVLGVEVAALSAALDATHEDNTARSGNSYTCGEIHGHDVVIVVLPVPGTNNSAVIERLRNDFPSIRLGVVVGVAGGVPDIYGRNDIRLGDVVVGMPSGANGGVVQFDKGKRHAGDRFELTGHLNKPPSDLMAAVNQLRGKYELHHSRLQQTVTNILRKSPDMCDRYRYPGAESDLLFDSNYEHQYAEDSTCGRCKTSQLRRREPHSLTYPIAHYGTVGSSNSLIRDAVQRDQLSSAYSILCVEMEAAGLVDELPCLVVKGICDYADSHKNKSWQPYAAVTAAAYVKDLFSVLSIQKTSLPTKVDIVPSHVAGLAENFVIDTCLQTTDAEKQTSLKILLGSLIFRRMDARQRNISSALSQTCNWLSSHKQYKQWKDRRKVGDHLGFLWIKGKPGCGKSTIMKKLLAWESKSRSKRVVISYFFNARASSILEKSSLGLYRSLTYQLLSAHPMIQGAFLEHFSSKRDGDLVEDWSVKELQEFLIEIIQDQLDRPLVFMIDALDEGDVEDIRQLVSFLEKMASEACEIGNDLRICLSSRYYPHISIRKGLHLMIEEEQGHDDDIRTYICETLALSDETATDLDELRDQICKKATGIFLWVVLVIPILKQAIDQGKYVSAKSLSKYLQEIPAELNALFGLILTRYIDLDAGLKENDRDDCLTLLQWVLFAKEALTPTQLYLAISLTSSSELYSDKHCPSQRLQRCLLNTSRGLIEISETETPVVQFIHETVREFLRRTGLGQIDPRLSDNVEGLSHEKLKSSCYQYVKTCANSLPDCQSMKRNEFQVRQAKSLEQFPLLQYVSKQLFAHSNSAHDEGISQEEFLQQNCAENSMFLHSWVRVHNIFEKVRTNQYTVNVSWLYIMAQQKSPSLLEILARETRDRVSGEKYGTALQAACKSGDEQAARILVAHGSNINEEGGSYKHAFLAAVRSKSEALIQYLSNQQIRMPQDLLDSCLISCCRTRYLAGVATTIKLGANPNALNKNGSVLCIASAKGCREVVQLLIDKGADLNKEGGQYGSPLLAASSEDHPEIAQLLIDKGADVNAKGGRHGSALQAASLEGHREVVQLLLDRRANVNAQGGYYGNALQAASYGGHQEVVQLLLERGANVNAQGGAYFVNALQAASYMGEPKVVQMLLENGADVNAQGGECVNALKAARAGICDKDRAVEQILIAYGAKEM